MDCLICGRPLLPTRVAAPDRLVTGEGPFRVLACASCDFGVTLPQLSNEQLVPYYAESYYEEFYEHSNRGPAGLLYTARERFRRRGATRRYGARPFAPLPIARPGRMLDVGCGDGSLLAHFARQGWEAVGLDPSSAAAAAVRRQGFAAHKGTLDDHPWEPGSFDLITFQHSLEHIPDPMRALEAAAALLAPGGLLVASVPNWDCWHKWLFGSRWFHLDLPRHQQHFSTTALRRASERVGLRPVDWGEHSTLISAAYSIHYVLAGRWTPGKRLWLAYLLGALVSPVFRLVDRRLGADCCYVVAQRSPVYEGAPQVPTLVPE